MEPGTSAVEKLLDIVFVSDPRQSKHPLPKPPKGHPRDLPYTVYGHEVTKQVARDWLTHRVIHMSSMPRDLHHEDMDPNRRMSPQRVRHWSQVLLGKSKNGEEWRDSNPQGLVFSPDGFILDGQHRLAGCAHSGQTFRVAISHNVPWSALAVMDTPMRRNAGQMTNVPHPQLASQIARYLMPAIQGVDNVEYTMRSHMRELVVVTQTWPWFQNAAWLTNVNKLRTSLGIPSVPLGAVVIGALAAGAPVWDVQSFMDGIDAYKSERVPVGKAATDPRKLIGQRYLRRPRPYRDEDLRSDAALFRKAMTAWLDRNEDGQPGIERLQKIPATHSIPRFWHSDAIREFHEENSKEN